MKFLIAIVGTLTWASALVAWSISLGPDHHQALGEEALAGIRGAGEGYKRATEGTNPPVVLWWNCAYQNKGSHTEAAKCYPANDPNHNNGDDCIRCQDTGLEPAVKPDSTANPGYLRNDDDPDRECGGKLWRGVCTISGQCTLGVQLTSDCADPVPKYLEQTQPTPP